MICRYRSTCGGCGLVPLVTSSIGDYELNIHFQEAYARLFSNCSNKQGIQSNLQSKSWLVGCFGLNGPLRQYFSLYRADSQREGERKEVIDEIKKMAKQPPPAPTTSAIGPCSTIIQISRTPRHWKFTQHLRTTRPPPQSNRPMNQGTICAKVYPEGVQPIKRNNCGVD